MTYAESCAEIASLGGIEVGSSEQCTLFSMPTPTLRLRATPDFTVAGTLYEGNVMAEAWGEDDEGVRTLLVVFSVVGREQVAGMLPDLSAQSEMLVQGYMLGQ